MFTWTCPLSSTHGTRNLNCLSGSTSLSSRASFLYFSSLASTTTLNDSNTSFTAWWNSGSAGFFATTFSRTSSTYDILFYLLKLNNKTGRQSLPACTMLLSFNIVKEFYIEHKNFFKNFFHFCNFKFVFLQTDDFFVQFFPRLSGVSATTHRPCFILHLLAF